MADELTKEEEKMDWYSVLGIEVSVDDNAISKAFKKMSLRWHPDKNGGSQEAHDMFMKVKEAKMFLLDGKKRKLYDEKRAARHKMESLLAERNRNMGQRRRQVREELERRESEVANGSSSSNLGAGGEARVAAAKLDELRKQGDAKREQQSRERGAAWDFARASAKKRRASSSLFGSGKSGGDGDLEERTVRVKWLTRKESHSDHTLDVLFSRFGRVESVTIEEGTGDRALVVFASTIVADAAVAAYRDSETMRAKHIGKGRPKRNTFAARRQTMSPMPTRYGAGGGMAAAAGRGEGESPTVDSFRDRESLVMMKLRQEAERQALIRKMAQEEVVGVTGNGGAVKGNGGAATAPPETPPRATEGQAEEEEEEEEACSDGGLGRAADSASKAKGTSTAAASSEAANACAGRAGLGDVDKNVGVRPMDTEGERGAPAAASAGSESRGNAVSGGEERRGKPLVAFPVPSPVARAVRTAGDSGARRESDVLSAMMSGGAGGGGRSRVSGFVVGTSKSMPTTPVSGRGVGSGGGAIDEGDILARMMAMKR